MSLKHRVIYISGLGDQMPRGQIMALKIWKIHGLEAEYFRIGWSDGEAFGPKLERIVKRIDQLAAAGYKVSLVGASAGASAVLSAFAERKDKVTGVVCICGKINNPQTISNYTLKKNPAFKDAMELLPASLQKLSSADRKRILSLHPIRDSVVKIKDTFVDGAVKKRLPIMGHSFSIAYAITFGTRLIARFLKKLD